MEFNREQHGHAGRNVVITAAVGATAAGLYLLRHYRHRLESNRTVNFEATDPRDKTAVLNFFDQVKPGGHIARYKAEIFDALVMVAHSDSEHPVPRSDFDPILDQWSERANNTEEALGWLRGQHMVNTRRANRHYYWLSQRSAWALFSEEAAEHPLIAELQQKLFDIEQTAQIQDVPLEDGSERLSGNS